MSDTCGSPTTACAAAHRNLVSVVGTLRIISEYMVLMRAGLLACQQKKAGSSSTRIILLWAVVRSDGHRGFVSNWSDLDYQRPRK